MNLSHGGHLTHGHPLNFSGKLYTIVPYGVRQDDERLDYDELERLADEHKPKMIMVGASAYPRVIDFARIRAVADRVGAAMVADMAHIAGLVAGGVHPSPVPHADFVTTTTHKTLRGPRGGPRPVQGEVGEGPRPVACSPACRAGRSCTSSRPRPCASRRRWSRPSRRTSGRSSPTRERWPAVDRLARLPPRVGRHRQPPDAGGRVLEGPHRQGRRRPRSARPASPSTRTRSRSTRTRRSRPAASASARRP